MYVNIPQLYCRWQWNPYPDIVEYIHYKTKPQLHLLQGIPISAGAEAERYWILALQTKRHAMQGQTEHQTVQKCQTTVHPIERAQPRATSRYIIEHFDLIDFCCKSKLTNPCLFQEINPYFTSSTTASYFSNTTKPQITRIGDVNS